MKLLTKLTPPKFNYFEVSHITAIVEEDFPFVFFSFCTIEAYVYPRG